MPLSTARFLRWLARRADKRGRRASKAGFHRHAIRWFQIATRLTPDIGSIWLRLAQAHHRVGDFDAAISATRMGRLNNPRHLELAMFLTRLLLETDHQTEAVGIWSEIFDDARKDSVRRLALRRLHDLGNHEATEAAASRLLTRNAHDPDASLVLASLALIRSGDRSAAEDLIKRADGAGNPELWRAVAAAFLQLGDARRAWELLTDLPEEHVVPSELASVALVLGSPADLEHAYQVTARALDAKPGDAGLRRVQRRMLMALGRAAYTAGRYPDALKWFRKSHNMLGPTQWTWLWQARVHRAAGDIDASRKCVDQALVRDAGWLPGLLHLADLLKKEGRVKESIETWRRILKVEQLDSGRLRQAAWVLLQLGDAPTALEAVDRALTRDPADHEAVAIRALVLQAVGRHAEASTLVEKLESQDDSVALTWLVRFQVRQGDPLAAWELCRRLPSSQQEAGLLAEVVRGLRQQGHINVAAAAAQQASDRHREDDRLVHLRRACVGEYEVLSGNWSAVPRRVGAMKGVKGRILHVVGKSLPHVQSGYTVRTFHIVRAQHAMGLEPHVVTQLGFPWDQGIGEASVLDVLNGIAHHRILPTSTGLQPLSQAMVDNVEELAQLVRRVRPAALHPASDYRNAMLALELGRAFDLPIIYEVRGLWEESWLSKRDQVGIDTSWYRLRQERELESMGRADRVVTIADTMREQLVERGVAPDKIVVVPNAVDPDAFIDQSRDEALASALGLTGWDPVVGYISSFVPYEGIRYLIEAAADLRDRGHPVRCLLVGDGESRRELERHAAELGVADAVVFAGRVPHEEVPRYYGLIDVFVVPRTNDRVCHLVTPLKPFEAMAAGLPVVMSGTRALRSMVRDGETGLVFEPEDSKDLADQVERLLLDPALRLQLGEAARRQVLKNHTWKTNSERYLTIYRELGVA